MCQGRMQEINHSPKTHESNFIHREFVQFRKSIRDIGYFAIHCFVTAVL